MLRKGVSGYLRCSLNSCLSLLLSLGAAELADVVENLAPFSLSTSAVSKSIIWDEDSSAYSEKASSEMYVELLLENSGSADSHIEGI